MSTVRYPKVFASLLAISWLFLPACGDDPEENDPTLTAIRVEPASFTLDVGGTQQLTVTGDYDDGSTQPITGGVSFASSDESVATVTAGGLVTAVAPGSAGITVTAAGRSASASATVRGAEVEGAVFLDDYAEGVTFADFAGAANALTVEEGTLRVEVPAEGYTGGAMVSGTPVDLSGFNAVTFRAKASQEATLNVAGLGIDAADGPSYSAERTAIALTTDWATYVIPLPDPTKAGAVSGLFHFAEGADEGAYTLWLDDVRYESLPAADLDVPVDAAVAWPEAVLLAPGATVTLAASGNTVTFDLPELMLTNVSFRWFDLASSDTSVATVDPAGLVTAVAVGTAEITASLTGLDAPGAATVTVAEAAQEPETAPAAPTADPADVISLFSQAYDDVTVDTWRTEWSAAELTEVTLAGEPMKRYSNLDFVGVEFTGANMIDASGMDFFHVDLWTPNATTFRIKLVDFGADGAFGGGDDTEHELAFDAGSTPALTTGEWVSLDIPMAAFANLTGREHLAQLIFSALPTGSATAFVTNVYFYRTAIAQAPTAAPPAPTAPAAEVISLFSQAYDDVTVDTWRTDWSAATLADVTIDGEPMKQYTSLDFVGVEFTGANMIDASGMTYFHVDVWTPNATTFRVKLVDFGADGAWDGGDNSEHEVVFDATTTPALVAGQWVSLDIPLADFTELTARDHLAQLIFSALPTGAATVYVDNVYFHQ